MTIDAVPEGACRFEELAPIKVKGRESLVAVYRATKEVVEQTVPEIANSEFAAAVDEIVSAVAPSP